jgi:hypothetical protein
VSHPPCAAPSRGFVLVSSGTAGTESSRGPLGGSCRDNLDLLMSLARFGSAQQVPFLQVNAYHSAGGVRGVFLCSLPGNVSFMYDCCDRGGQKIGSDWRPQK